MSVDTERRSGGERFAIKTLVEIGAGQGGSAAFEAESVDLTTAGMHLKTAYLPEVGEPLVCRLELDGREAVVNGEVVWRNEEAYGGEFGVRFLEMDAESLQVIRDTIGECATEEEQADELSPTCSAPASTNKSTRVRLLLKGGSSAMQARVSQTTQSEVVTVSRIETLKLGSHVSIENAEGPGRRDARIERVAIQVDPSSHVPELVVSMRYVESAGALAEAAPSARTAPSEPVMAHDEPCDEPDEDKEHASGKAAQLWNKVRDMGPKLHAVTDAAKALGGKAKGIVRDAVEKTRGANAGQRDEQAKPRRTTSPAPNGALRGDGRRVVRDFEESADQQPAAAPVTRKLPKRAAMIGLVLVLLTVVGVSLARRSSGSSDEATAAQDSVQLPVDGALPGAGLGAELQAGALAQGALTANVPLFGATALSTASPAAMGVAAVAAATPPPAEPAAFPPSAQDNAADEEEGDELADEGDEQASAKSAAAAVEADSADDEEEAAPAPAAKPKKATRTASSSSGSKSFGRGKVRNPTVLTLRMSNSIKAIRGSASSKGFTIQVDGAKAKEPAAGFRRQDSRIASASVVNAGKGAELTVRFKNAAPGYRVQAQGSTLRILIDNDGSVASKSSGKARNKASTKSKK